MVGADYFLPKDTGLRALVTSNRFVFITGPKDFNQREMEQVHQKYLDAGVARSLLMNIPGLGHEFPSADQLSAALDFLDAG